MRGLHQYSWIVLIAWLGVGLRSASADDLVSTSTHRFWVTNRDANGDGVLGDWIEAGDLISGDRFRLGSGGEAVLRATEFTHRGVESSSIHSNLQPSTFNFQPVTTYNFAVADTHTYFVGKQGVWVHNTGGPCEVKKNKVEGNFMVDLKDPKQEYLVRSRIGEVMIKVDGERRVSGNSKLAKLAQEATHSPVLQDQIDGMVRQIAHGNLHPGQGSGPLLFHSLKDLNVGPIYKGAHKAHGAPRIFYWIISPPEGGVFVYRGREYKGIIEILGKARKDNEHIVVKHLMRKYEARLKTGRKHLRKFREN